jgi:hypothetical protein
MEALTNHLIQKGDIVQTINKKTFYFVKEILQTVAHGEVAVCKVYRSSETVTFKCSDLIVKEIR